MILSILLETMLLPLLCRRGDSEKGCAHDSILDAYGEKAPGVSVDRAQLPVGTMTVQANALPRSSTATRSIA